MDQRYKRLGKNTIIVFLGSAGSKLIGLLMLPYYTHCLTKAEYGISDLINTYSSILLAFVTCCIADSIFIFPKDKSIKEKTEFFTSGILFVCFSLLLISILTSLSRKLLSNNFFQDYIWWIVALTYGHFLLSYCQQFTRSIDKMIVYSLTGIVYVASIAVFSFIFIPLFQLKGYLLALLSACLISSIFTCVFAKSYRYFKLSHFDKKSLTVLLKYGIPLIPNSVMWWIVEGLNRPIMMSELGAGAIGLYAVANKIPSVLAALIGIFSNAWSISLLEEFDKSDFNLFFNNTMRFLFFIVAIGALCLILGCKWIISILASPEFYEAWRYVPFLILAIIFQNLSSLIGGVFSAEKKSKYFFYSSLWGAICSLSLTFLFVRWFGLMGVCISLSCSFLCMALVRLKYAWRYINKFNFSYYSINISAIVLLAVVYIWDQRLLMVLLTFVFSGIIIFLNNKEEARILISLVDRVIRRRRI